MTQAFRYPGPLNGFMPANTGYIISYIRKKSEFPLNRYVQLVQADKPQFYYWQIDRDQPVRKRDINLHLWTDGMDRPIHNDNNLGFRTQPGTCIRYDFDTVLGNITIKTNEWNAKQQHLNMLACQAMEYRTAQALSTLETVSNWGANTADANVLNGGAGTWDRASDEPSDANYNAIKKAMASAVIQIFSQTNGRVKYRDLQMIVSPNLAKAMANTAEIHNYLKYGSPGIKEIEGDEDNYNERFGLPSRLYGVRVIVEDTPFVQDLPVASQTTGSTNRSFQKKDTTAIFASRPGGLDGNAGTPSFSTLQLYWYDRQMSAYEFDDTVNQKLQIHIEDFYCVLLPAPESGYLISNVLA